MTMAASTSLWTKGNLALLDPSALITRNTHTNTPTTSDKEAQYGGTEQAREGKFSVPSGKTRCQEMKELHSTIVSGALPGRKTNERTVPHQTVFAVTCCTVRGFLCAVSNRTGTDCAGTSSCPASPRPMIHLAADEGRESSSAQVASENRSHRCALPGVRRSAESVSR